MNMPTRILAIAATLLAGAGALEGPASGERSVGRGDITWTVTAAATPDRLANLQFSHRTSNISISLDTDPTLADARAVLDKAGSVTFVIDREAGALTCRGTLKSTYSGKGNCSFAPDRRFAEDLRTRGVAPLDEAEQLALALLDVDRGMIDGLIREGVAPRSAQDAIAAGALKVTPEYVGGLKRAGLALSSIDDAVACRALGIDAAYLRALAEVGYGADVQQVIAMKAVGVTPDYARRMNASVHK